MKTQLKSDTVLLEAAIRWARRQSVLERLVKARRAKHRKHLAAKRKPKLAKVIKANIVHHRKVKEAAAR